tara:strand:- start:1189 stop:1827 length:639 start_codon:yes stop_codon:yes gene_type:complete
MASQDHIVIVNQHWIGKSERLDTFADLAKLFFGMSSCVARVRLEFLCRQIFNLQIGHLLVSESILSSLFRKIRKTIEKSNGRVMNPSDDANKLFAAQPKTDMEDIMSLGSRMTELRLQAKQSLQDVASAVGVSKAHIWELEKGKTDNPSMGLVQRLADHFGVSVTFMVDEDIEAPDADTDLQRMFRQAKKLNDRERKILDEMMSSLLRNKES